MSESVEQARPTLWEWRAELDSGFSFDWDTGKSTPWTGHRIRYRKQGTRRWSTFLLSKDGDVNPTETEVLRAIEAHAHA